MVSFWNLERINLSKVYFIHLAWGEIFTKKTLSKSLRHGTDMVLQSYFIPSSGLLYDRKFSWLWCQIMSIVFQTKETSILMMSGQRISRRFLFYKISNSNTSTQKTAELIIYREAEVAKASKHSPRKQSKIMFCDSLLWVSQVLSATIVLLLRIPNVSSTCVVGRGGMG